MGWTIAVECWLFQGSKKPRQGGGKTVISRRGGGAQGIYETDAARSRVLKFLVSLLLHHSFGDLGRVDILGTGI
jgi:hypothetical protein